MAKSIDNISEEFLTKSKAQDWRRSTEVKLRKSNYITILITTKCTCTCKCNVRLLPNETLKRI